MTLKEAKNLKIGDAVYQLTKLTKKGKPWKWKACSEDHPFLVPRSDLGRCEKENERYYPYRVRVLLKSRFGEWFTLTEEYLEDFTQNENI